MAGRIGGTSDVTRCGLRMTGGNCGAMYTTETTERRAMNVLSCGMNIAT